MIIRKQPWLAAPALLVSLACGDGNKGTSDSSGGTMAMGDSAAAAGSMAGDSNTTGTQNNAGMTDPSMAQLMAMVNRDEVQAGTLASTKARNADVKAFAREMVTEHRNAQRRLDSIAKPSGWMIDSASMASGMGVTGGNMSGGTASGGSTTGGTGTSSSGTGGTGTGGTGTTGGTGSTAGTTGATGGSMGATNPQGDSRLNTMMQQMMQTQQTAMQQLRSATGAEFDRSYMDSQLAGHQQVLDMLNQYMNNVQSNELRTYVTDVKNSVQKHKERAEQIRQKLGSS